MELSVVDRYATLLYDKGEYGKIVAELEKGTRIFPDNFVLNLVVGLAYSQLDNHKEAEKFLSSAVRLNPKDLTALSAYGFTLNQLGKNQKAIVYLNKALEVDNNNSEIYGLLGLIYENLKEWELCDSMYQKAISIDSTNSVLLNNYAYSLAVRGKDLQNALRMAQKAIDKEPNNDSFLDTIGWTLF